MKWKGAEELTAGGRCLSQPDMEKTGVSEVDVADVLAVLFQPPPDVAVMIVAVLADAAVPPLVMVMKVVSLQVLDALKYPVGAAVKVPLSVQVLVPFTAQADDTAVPVGPAVALVELWAGYGAVPVTAAVPEKAVPGAVVDVVLKLAGQIVREAGSPWWCQSSWQRGWRWGLLLLDAAADGAETLAAPVPGTAVVVGRPLDPVWAGECSRRRGVCPGKGARSGPDCRRPAGRDHSRA